MSIASAALFLTGCNSEGGTVALPIRIGPTSEVPSNPSNTEEIKDSYQKFVAILDQAESLPRDTRRQQLATYMVDPQLSRVYNQSIEIQKNNLISYGSTIAHIKSIQVNGNVATVRDCQDSANAGLMNATTRKKINRGVKEENISVSLKKGSDGRWRVSKMTILGKGC